MGALLSILGSILPDLVKRVLPAEKMSEQDAAKLQTDLTFELLKLDWGKVEAEYQDRASARALAAQDIAKGNAFTGILAAFVRPAWGFGALVMVGYSVVYGAAISSPLQEIIQTVLFFYFGGRTIEKITPMIAQGFKR